MWNDPNYFKLNAKSKPWYIILNKRSWVFWFLLEYVGLVDRMALGLLRSPLWTGSAVIVSSYCSSYICKFRSSSFNVISGYLSSGFLSFNIVWLCNSYNKIIMHWSGPLTSQVSTWCIFCFKILILLLLHEPLTMFILCSSLTSFLRLFLTFKCLEAAAALVFWVINFDKVVLLFNLISPNHEQCGRSKTEDLCL